MELIYQLYLKAILQITETSHRNVKKWEWPLIGQANVYIKSKERRVQ